jgi:primary-amine oxidase
VDPSLETEQAAIRKADTAKHRFHPGRQWRFIRKSARAVRPEQPLGRHLQPDRTLRCREFPNQSSGKHDGLHTWTLAERNIVDEDLVVW